MGHWSERLADDVAQQLGGNVDRRALIEVLERAGQEIEVLSGRTFQPLREASLAFESSGLPFVDMPDLHVEGHNPFEGAWPAPDPVNPQIATVLQVHALQEPAPRAAPIGDALWYAGQILAQASQTGRLSREYVLDWLGAVPSAQREKLLRSFKDPSMRFMIPILGTSIRGWWIQVARRLLWATHETEDEGRLFEIILDGSQTTVESMQLAATEPVMIVARMTRQPTDWAFTARVWPENVRLPVGRSWNKISDAIHGYGIPTITVDPVSTPDEVGCQTLLKGYWHGYIDGNEPRLAKAIAHAYPTQVERVQRVTRAPTSEAAAAILLEYLIRPGFDPGQGAELTRRYVHRKASIAVMEYRKSENPDRYPWTQLGIKERHFYKLLPLFAQKTNGRYDYDHNDVVRRMREHLDQADRDRKARSLALELLQDRGFSEAAARKWIQRHPLHEAVHAQPRT